MTKHLRQTKQTEFTLNNEIVKKDTSYPNVAQIISIVQESLVAKNVEPTLQNAKSYATFL
jgi:hypothetical protein